MCSSDLSAFVLERACDLIAVLGLCLFIEQRSNMLLTAFAFVALFLAMLTLLINRPVIFAMFAEVLRRAGMERISRLIHTLQVGLVGCRIWLTGADLLVCFTTGLLAWTMTSYAFVVLLGSVGVAIPTLPSLSIYPLSMLVGAASMLPGGIGSTEAAIVAILGLFSVPLGIAIACATGIRLSSIWFAVISGFIAIALLERSQKVLAMSNICRR